MKLHQTFIPLILILFFACRAKQSEPDLNEAAYFQFIETGNAIASEAQAILLSYVSNAIREGGPEHAVEFCNLNASGIMDSLKNVHNCTISRVTDKTRNPLNKFLHNYEKNLWDYYRTGAGTASRRDTVVAEDSVVIYYKPILTALPACMQCHGPVDRMDPDTYSRIRKLYPEDQATGYALNDLRGMWKIEFDRNEGPTPGKH